MRVVLETNFLISLSLYQLERTVLDIHIVAHDPFKDDLLVPTRGLSKSDALT